MRSSYEMSDATDATAATTGGQRQGVEGQDLQATRELMLEMEKNQLGDPLLFLERPAQMQGTRAWKSAEAAIKQIATQKLHSKKEKMREWIQVVMQEVTHGLHIIRQVYEEAMEAQRYGFQTEIAKVREKLQRVELRLTTLENEMNILKSQKQTPEQRPTQAIPKTTSTISLSIKPPKEKKTPSPAGPESLAKALLRKMLSRAQLTKETNNAP